MRRILLSGLFLLLPAAAHAQAQGGPDAPKPADPATPADAAKPADATPPASATPTPETPAAPTDASAAAGAELNAGGPAGPSAAANAGATTETEAAPPKPIPVVARRGQTAGSDESSWKFDYHGYLRAPLRFGIGKRLPEDTPGYDPSLQGETTWHEATVPDDQYLSFQSTGHNMRSWGEGFFSFGNQLASGTLGIGSYNFTEAGFNDVDAQWGITQGYVTLTPDLGYENVRLWAKAGAIVDKYGQAGRYDPGEYDTYMFGRTHVMGETLHVDYDVSDSWTLGLEQGFGSKKPDPSQYNNARYTMLHHEHVTLKQGRDLEFGAHFLHSWSNEEYRPSASVDLTKGIPRGGLPTGHLWVAGADARAELGAFGYIYGGFSHVRGRYAVTVSRAIEVLSASGGGEFELGVTANYFDSPNCAAIQNPAEVPPPGVNPPQGWFRRDFNGCSDGNGSINALQAHYEFSLTNFQDQISGGQRFWGRGFDVIVKLYALAAFVNSEARDTTKAAQDGGVAGLATVPEGYSVTKWKAGADVTVQVADFLSPGIRFDRVQPNNHIPEQSFAVLSPRLQFKSAWVTHERITLGYSRYFYDQRTCEPATVNGVVNPDPLYLHRCTQPPPSAVPYEGFGSAPDKQDAGNRATGVKRPDENVFKVEATMWW